MANEMILISGIGYKVRKLIDTKDHLLKENKQLKQELESARVLIEQLQDKLENKRNKLMEISLANALTEKESVEEGIKIIDRLVEEIDTGIDVLSD